MKSEVGITPAYAGKSQNGRCNDFDKRDHPRLCGEKFYYRLLSTSGAGSPPPMRGKAYMMYTEGIPPWITPAYAGKSIERRIISKQTKDHPRLCGEKWNQL